MKIHHKEKIKELSTSNKEELIKNCIDLPTGVYKLFILDYTIFEIHIHVSKETNTITILHNHKLGD